MRFTLGPVAEYLAGLHITKQCSSDGDAWWRFLAEADSSPGGPAAIRGFVPAVRNCRLAANGGTAVSDFVPDELGRRAGLTWIDGDRRGCGSVSRPRIRMIAGLRRRHWGGQVPESAVAALMSGTCGTSSTEP